MLKAVGITQTLQKSIKQVIQKWEAIERKMDAFREEIANDFFEKYPYRMETFIPQSQGQNTEEDNRKKLFKHSVAVINFMNAVINFVRGNEESKPIFFVLGKQHKNALVSEKMFLEMKDAICRVIKKRFDNELSNSWEVVIDYIYANYVFPGMNMYARGCFPKFYTVFAPDFKKPETDREDIKKILKTKSRDEIVALRIKPALNYVPCSVFYHPDVERLINYILREGKRELAKTIVRETFTRVKHMQLREYNREIDENKKKDIIINPLEVFLLAIKNVTPLLWYIKIRKSGSWFKVPVGISEEKARKKALKWIVECSKEKGTKTSLAEQLAIELVDAAQYKGKALNKKLDLHKMCEANRGYVHYWWT